MADVRVEKHRVITKVTLRFDADSLYDAFMFSMSRSTDPVLQGFYKTICKADDRADLADEKNGISTGDANTMERD